MSSQKDWPICKQRWNEMKESQKAGDLGGWKMQLILITKSKAENTSEWQQLIKTQLWGVIDQIKDAKGAFCWTDNGNS